MPERIQRKRTKGWKKPSGAIDCTRSSVWGNPFRIGRFYMFRSHDALGVLHPCEIAESEYKANADSSKYFHITDAAAAVAAHRLYLEECGYGKFMVSGARQELKGHDLMCWCALDSPCHVDTWLEISNTEAPDHGQ